MALLRNLVTSQRRRLTWRSARRPTTHLRCRLPIPGWTRIFSSCMSFEGLGEWASEEERREEGSTRWLSPVEPSWGSPLASFPLDLCCFYTP